MVLASRPEKLSQQSARFVRISATFDDGPMMAGHLREIAGAVFDRTAFRIGGGVYEPLQPREADGPCAHGARLKGYIKRCPNQPLIAQPLRAFPYGEDLRVRGRIMGFDDSVAGPRNDAVANRNQHCANRHLATLACRLGFHQGDIQIVQVLLFHGPQDTRKP